MEGGFKVAKPSIFSNRYRKEMKKRRNRRIITILSAIVLIAFVILLISASLTDWTKKISNVKNGPRVDASNNQNTISKNDAGKTNEEVNKNDNQQKPVDKVFTVNLADGKSLNITYDDTLNTRKITNLQNQDPDIDFNINPSSTAAIAYEKSTQTVLLVKADGTSSDVTNTSYTSSSGNVFNKDSILKDNQNYIWEQSPKFIDDDNIAYITQLPWFDNRTSKFIWKYNIKDNTNVNTNITGTNIQINNVSDKGLEIVTDNVVQYLKGDGSITK